MNVRFYTEDTELSPKVAEFILEQIRKIATSSDKSKRILVIETSIVDDEKGYVLRIDVL